MNAIECRNVSKNFGEKIVLDNLNFSLEEGKIYALLGRNGAGKTTLLNCMCTRYIPSKGDVYLLEEKAYENAKVLSEICFMSDRLDAFDNYKVKAILKYARCFYPRWNEALMNRLLECYEISPKENYAFLSKGRKTALSLIIGLCCGCRIVLFDEIYSGLDAVGRQQFYELLLEEQEKNPRTFVLSTHLIEEMTMLFEEVVILDKGKILLQEEMEELEEKSFRATARVNEEGILLEKNILAKKEMGAMAEYYIYDTISMKEKQQLLAQGITLQNMNLQELFIALTTDAIKEKEK